MYVYINGSFVSEAEARISVFDHGFLYGDGVFEACSRKPVPSHAPAGSSSVQPRVALSPYIKGLQGSTIIVISVLYFIHKISPPTLLPEIVYRVAKNRRFGYPLCKTRIACRGFIVYDRYIIYLYRLS